MEINESNVQWAMQKLSRFVGWPGFPQEPEGIESRARSFLRLVHNKTARQILVESRQAQGRDPSDLTFEILPKYGLAPEDNDVEWILNLIEETFEEFPKPIVMRRAYSPPLAPSTSMGDLD